MTDERVKLAKNDGPLLQKAKKKRRCQLLERVLIAVKEGSMTVEVT